MWRSDEHDVIVNGINSGNRLVGRPWVGLCQTLATCGVRARDQTALPVAQAYEAGLGT